MIKKKAHLILLLALSGATSGLAGYIDPTKQPSPLEQQKYSLSPSSEGIHGEITGGTLEASEEIRRQDIQKKRLALANEYEELSDQQKAIRKRIEELHQEHKRLGKERIQISPVLAEEVLSKVAAKERRLEKQYDAIWQRRIAIDRELGQLRRQERGYIF